MIQEFKETGMNLAYLYGQPQQEGFLKTEFTDFIVKEDLGYELANEGEFVAVKVRKTNVNTLFVGEKLAKFVGISAKQMSYAGLKDRHAVSEQWFCLHLPGKPTPDFTLFELEGVEILEITRHNRKIRVGALKGNHFELVIRGIQETQEIEQRLKKIKTIGFPNYFTEQRFGRDGYNLTQAQRWASGEIKVKDRKKRSFYLSAARSDIFNQVVSDRIQKNLISQVVSEDLLQLSGSNSFFQATDEQLGILQQRLTNYDILLTAPLVGEDSLNENIPCIEKQVVIQYTSLLSLMNKVKMKSARRTMLCKPQHFNWQFINDGLKLTFFLQAGSYATALARELALIKE